MFGDLKSVIDLVRSGITDLRKLKAERTREQTILGVLKMYFLLKDCVDEGEALIADAGPDPVRKSGQWNGRMLLPHFNDGM